MQSPQTGKEKPEDEKGVPGNMANYVKRGDEYKCKRCDGIIYSVRVAHPVHLYIMPNSGFGQCQYEDAPYCPNCERKPDINGDVVYE